MHAERTAQRGDVHDAVHHVGQLVAQRVELVDDHHEPWRRETQCGDVLRMLFGDQPFPAFQFKIERMQRAHRMLQVEIAYAAHAVGEPFERAEGRAALEVEEHELQAFRRVARGQGEAPALQQHGFAGSRGAGHQRVRSLPLQVEADHVAFRQAYGHVHRERVQPAPRHRAPG